MLLFFLFCKVMLMPQCRTLPPVTADTRLKTTWLINEVGFQCDACKLSLYVAVVCNLGSDVNLQIFDNDKVL